MCVQSPRKMWCEREQRKRGAGSLHERTRATANPRITVFALCPGPGSLPSKGALHEPRMHGKTYCPTRPASVILLSERGGRSSRELALPFRPLGHTSRPDAARVKVPTAVLHANQHTASCTTCIDPFPAPGRASCSALQPIPMCERRSNFPTRLLFSTTSAPPLS